MIGFYSINIEVMLYRMKLKG